MAWPSHTYKIYVYFVVDSNVQNWRQKSTTDNISMFINYGGTYIANL